MECCPSFRFLSQPGITAVPLCNLLYNGKPETCSISACGCPDRVMGFSQAKTTHHFRLLEDGGSIEVGANDPKDAVSKDQIRQHLEDIAGAFSEGEFEAPMEIHKQTPPGAPVMRELKASIDYRFEPTQSGGQVRITTADKRALDAIHEFLRFQIEEHQTGDPLSVASK